MRVRSGVTFDRTNFFPCFFHLEQRLRWEMSSPKGYCGTPTRDSMSTCT
jgi:hypothetical protein